jgi:catechol 2,3-dioxygenase-like lactoylglutathione lyase family enzyme
VINSLRHFGIVVSDLNRALDFYQRLLGLSVQRRMDESGEFLDRLLGVSNAHVTTVKLAAGSGPTLLELLDFHSPESQPITRTVFSQGPTHVAFTVANLSGLYEKLTAEGIRFVSPVQTSPDGRAKVAFCFDPDGNLLELVEVIPPVSL